MISLFTTLNARKWQGKATEGSPEGKKKERVVEKRTGEGREHAGRGRRR